MPPRRPQCCDEIVDCFEEFVKKFLIFISLAVCAVAAMLAYILKLILDKIALSAPQPGLNQGNSLEPSDTALHNTDSPDGSPDRAKGNKKQDDKKDKKKENNKKKKGFFGTKNKEVKSAMTVQVCSTVPGCVSSFSMNEILKEIGFDPSPKMSGSTSDTQLSEPYHNRSPVPHYTTSNSSLFSQTKSSIGVGTPSNASSFSERPPCCQNPSCGSLRSNAKTLIDRPPPYYKRLLLIPPPSPSIIKSPPFYGKCSQCAIQKQPGCGVCHHCRNRFNN